MHAHVITTLPELQKLGDHWSRLASSSPDATPWQGFEFTENWWRHMGAARKLRVIVVEREGAPCLIMPLQVSRWPLLGFIPVRVLEPIGAVLDINRPRLALGPADEAAYQCAFEAIWAMRGEWDTLRIDEKAEDDAEILMLRRFAGERQLRFRFAFSHPCPYLDLRQDWEAYIASRGGKLRKNLRAAKRRLEARGEVRLQSCESAADVAAGFAVAMRLHDRSWKRGKGIEHSRSQAYRSFYSGWLEAMAGQGRARILVLWCADAPVAATIAFNDGRTYFSAQIVHDAAYDACSPGTLLEAMELEELMRGGRFAHYDFMGGFLSNKLRWTDSFHPTYHAYAMRRVWVTWLLDRYYFWFKPWARPWALPLMDRLRGRKPQVLVPSRP